MAIKSVEVAEDKSVKDTKKRITNAISEIETCVENILRSLNRGTLKDAEFASSSARRMVDEAQRVKDELSDLEDLLSTGEEDR